MARPLSEATIDPVERLHEALRDRYAFERELGRGGMATVYLARDLRHDRPVALKVLHPTLAATLGPDRFLREIKLAARLQHPHVLTVHDSGEIAGAASQPPVLWFTMPFIEGESLRDRLGREKQLPLDEALRIVREAADALSYAHRHGVIHRDIKPENILLSDGHALVADFGISKAIGVESEQQLTETGLTLGTPAYMSPEQAAGAKDLDARTDIYSLATVLYEMLAGAPPFAAPTPQAMIARRFQETARPLREVRDSVPERVEEAVHRALARTPADRFATVAQFAEALLPTSTAATVQTRTPTRGPSATAGRPKVAAMALGLGFLIGLGVLFAWRRSHSGESPKGSRLIAVLPFENVGDSTDEYFADGVTDAVRGKLTAIPGLEVIAGGSSSEYKKSAKPLAQIARELGVGHLVVAKIRWARTADGASRVQVSPELVQIPADGSPVTRWQQPFDAALTDVFQVQADIAGRVVQALGVALADSTRRQLAERPTADLAAYDLYLKAEAASLGTGRTSPAALRQGIAFYTEAVERDPRFALAWARLSSAYTVLYANSVPSRDIAERARAAADSALALAPALPHAIQARASYFRVIARDNGRARESLARLKRLDLQDPQILAGIAVTEAELGLYESAANYLRRAERLDPRSPSVAANLGRLLTRLRRYEEADSVLARGLALSPGNTSGVLARTLVWVGKGDLEGARRVIREAEAEIPPKDVAIYLATYNELYWTLTPDRQALVLEGRPDDFDGDVGSWGLALAQIYAARGDRVRARAYADSARAGFAAQLAEAPEDGQLRALYALSLAYLGRGAEAIREGERGTALVPIDRATGFGTYVQQLLARVYMMAGEDDKAMDRIEALLKQPGFLSVGWLRLDPAFDPLRTHPRFKKLVGDAG